MPAPGARLRPCADSSPVNVRTDPTAHRQLKKETRIHGLRANTIDNGCTEGEALAAASRSPSCSIATDLSLTDVELPRALARRPTYGERPKKRIPLRRLHRRQMGVWEFLLVAHWRRNEETIRSIKT